MTEACGIAAMGLVERAPTTLVARLIAAVLWAALVALTTLLG